MKNNKIALFEGLLIFVSIGLYVLSYEVLWGCLAGDYLKRSISWGISAKFYMWMSCVFFVLQAVFFVLCPFLDERAKSWKIVLGRSVMGLVFGAFVLWDYGWKIDGYIFIVVFSVMLSQSIGMVLSVLMRRMKA